MISKKVFQKLSKCEVNFTMNVLSFLKYLTLRKSFETFAIKQKPFSNGYFVSLNFNYQKL